MFFRFCFEAAGERSFGGGDTCFCQAVVLTFVLELRFVRWAVTRGGPLLAGRAQRKCLYTYGLAAYVY
jgi:hypothetical protein